jgi:arginyl-tRNA synthetase
MKEILSDLLTQAINALKAQNLLPADITPSWQLTIPKTKEHGDFACNIAMTLSKVAQKNPREIATLIVAHLPPSSAIKTVKIEGPGFINFFMNEAEFLEGLKVILEKGTAFGRSNHGQQKSIQVEFVSANPTGPLHVGHGRGAAYGATLANLLSEIGYQVQKEYYVNDAGRQMNILAASVWLRYLEKCGLSFTFPANGYKGDYVNDIAAAMHTEHGNLLCCAEETLKTIQIHSQQTDPNQIDEAIDQIIAIAQKQLGERYPIVFNAGLHAIQADIDNDLQEFGVVYDRWYSEKSLEEKGLIKAMIEKLQTNHYLYEKDGALWFRSTDFGDDKDRVVVRENGQATYFASDIAYHYEKYLRGFHHIINIWGADHHGYVPRVKAALTALGLDASQLTVLLVQFAILYRGKERVQMSTRSGSFVTLRELRQEVGNDACRFFYVTRKAEQHMDFDLDLAKSETKDNPVYYIQYAHARIHSVHQKLLEQDPSWNWQKSAEQITRLQLEEEKSLVQKLSRYPSLLIDAAKDYEPHQVAQYLRELASLFHSYYNTHKVLTEDTALRDARMYLSLATKQVLFNGLTLLGVTPVEKM